MSLFNYYLNFCIRSSLKFTNIKKKLIRMMKIEQNIININMKLELYQAPQSKRLLNPALLLCL